MFKNLFHSKIPSIPSISMPSMPKIKIDKPTLFLYIVTLVFLIVFVYNRTYTPKIQEGMSLADMTFTEKYKTNQSIDNIYNKFYVSIYDQLFMEGNRLKFEVDRTASYTKMDKKSVVLDIGSGTGHHLRAFHQIAGETTGVEMSREMAKKSQENYPYIKINYGNALNNLMYPEGSFTHITMYYYTIYYFKDKYGILTNVYKWLRPGGYFVVHLVNRKMFDPVVGLSNPFVFVNPQKYAKKRITRSKIYFNDVEYSSIYDLDDKADTATFDEILKHKHTQNIVQNTHTVHMPSLKRIVKQAENIGFKVNKVLHMSPIQYEYNYLYIFQKPKQR